MGKLELPCPFCGGTARIRIQTYPDLEDRYRVSCVDCGATTWPRIIDGHRAVRAWNRRSPLPAASETSITETGG